MKASVWKISLLIVAVAVAAPAQTTQSNQSAVSAPNAGTSVTDDPVTTTRDAQGIWFIEGGTLYEVMEAMGYAVAQDRLWQMDIFRRQGRGTLSALLGSSQIPNDVFLRTISYTDDELTGFFDELSPDAQTLVTGYTDGINRRIGEFYAGAWMQMPYEYWLLGLQSVLQGPGLPVLPQTFTVNDTLAWLVLLQRNFDPEGQPGDIGQLDNATMVQTLIAAYGGIQPHAAARHVLGSALDQRPVGADLHPVGVQIGRRSEPRSGARRPVRGDPEPLRRRPNGFAPRPSATTSRCSGSTPRSRWAAMRGPSPPTRPRRATPSSTRVRRWASSYPPSSPRARSAAAGSRSRA